MTVSAALDAHAARLSASAGTLVTRDPQAVIPIVAGGGIAVLLGLPTVERRGIGGELAADVPLYVIGAAGGTADDMGAVLDALPSVLSAAGARAARPDRVALGDADVPAMTIETRIRIPTN